MTLAFFDKSNILNCLLVNNFFKDLLKLLLDKIVFAIEMQPSKENFLRRSLKIAEKLYIRIFFIF